MPGSLFDSSVWIAAIFTTHPFHQQAQTALHDATPAAPAVFCRSTQLSLLRLASTPALLKAYGADGLTNRDALVALDALLALDQVCEREEPPEPWRSGIGWPGAIPLRQRSGWMPISPPSRSAVPCAS